MFLGSVIRIVILLEALIKINDGHADPLLSLQL